MKEFRARATRISFLAAVIVAVLMLGLPAANPLVNVGPVDNAAAAAGDRVFTIGWPDFTTAIATLNPLLSTQAQEMMAIWPCYSYMFTHDVDGNRIGDLVKSYSVSPDGLTFNFKLVNNARFYDKNDPAAVHPLTAQDVIFTFWLVQNTTGNYLQSYFPVVNGQPIIEAMWTGTDSWDLYIQFSSVYAPVMSGMEYIPVLPQFIWATQKWDWDNFDTRGGIAPIIGSGPFYYNLDGLPQAGVVELERSPTWFATEEYGWQLRVNTLVVKNEASADSSLLDYRNGIIDMMESITPEQYNSAIPGQKWGAPTGFVYEYNLNQMTDEFRAANPAFKQGSNNQLLLDPAVKLAMAMAVDKTAWVSQVLDGLGEPADSLVPGISPWHYAYGLQPSEGGRAPVGEEPVQFSTAAARQLLWDAGWRYDQAGNPISATSTAYPVCKVGGSDPLQFRFWTLDTPSLWDAGARLIATWAAEAGIDLWSDYSVQNTQFMNTAWANADYDCWLWDWWFTPVSEVSVDIMSVLTTEAIGSWNDLFWSNATFDETYRLSLLEMDPSLRMIITDKLQRMAYENMGCQLVAYRNDLYAASSLGPDHWSNYGNWNVNWALIPDQYYPWLYMQIEPAGDPSVGEPLYNPAPTISGFTSYYETDTTTAVNFVGTGNDNNLIEYRWFFGDGVKTAWSTSPTASHTYTTDGYYNAYFAVRESSGLDHFVTVKKATVKVIDTTNTAPHDLYFTYSPSDPDTGTEVYLNATAIDDQGDPITFTWLFGDNTSGRGANVVHQFSAGAGSYEVFLFADDGHLGSVPRPVNYSRVVLVKDNTPPTCSVPDYPVVYKLESWTFSITSTDPDTRDLHRYTWNWGDGTALSVTTTTTATHTYQSAGDFVLTVSADDLTGLPGHNVSDSGNVHVQRNGSNIAPQITFFGVSKTNPVTGEDVTFTGTATDGNGDLLQFTFAFGDGTTAVMMQTVANETLTATHNYSTTGLKVAYLTVTDFTATPLTSSPLILNVLQGNQAPTVDPLSEMKRTTGDEITFTATATDPDVGDTLNYSWDFGDGTDWGFGQTVTHTYWFADSAAGYVYRVWVNDGMGHNVSAAAIAYINSVPVVTPLVPMTVEAVIVQTFSVTASDEDTNDALTYTWDWGDGSLPEVGGDTMTHAYAQVLSPTDYTLSVTVYDGWIDDAGVDHNVTTSTTVTVTYHDDVPPVAVAAAYPSGPYEGELVYLDGSGSSDNLGIVSYVWTFDDQGVPTTLLGANVSYTFMVAGSYDVTLNVTDAVGNYATTTITINVVVIPEFPTLLVPVAGMLALFAVVALKKRREEQ